MHGLNTNLSARSRRAFSRMEVTIEPWKRATCYFEAHGMARQEDRGGMAQIHGETVSAAGLQKRAEYFVGSRALERKIPSASPRAVPSGATSISSTNFKRIRSPSISRLITPPPEV